MSRIRRVSASLVEPHTSAGSSASQRAFSDSELGACAQWVVVCAVDLREERQAAQLGLANGVEVVGAVALGVELAKQVGEHADVGELLI